MIAAKENAQTIINKLNEIHQLDPTVLETLIPFRVPCNQALSEHPTVQVGKNGDGFEVGLLGILNGLVGVKTNGWGFIGANYDDGHLKEFVLLD